MATLMLERPPTPTPLRAGRQRAALLELVRRLEDWLPATERRLAIARGRGQPALAHEAEWQAMLGLYERLCTALA